MLIPKFVIIYEFVNIYKYVKGMGTRINQNKGLGTRDTHGNFVHFPGDNQNKNNNKKKKSKWQPNSEEMTTRRLPSDLLS